MQIIDILLLFTFFKTALTLNSYDATQLCNENILANNPPFVTNIILGQASVPYYQRGPQLKIPITSQENAFWKLQTDQTVRFNLQNTFETRFWITGVAINEIPPFDPQLQFDCNLDTNELDTQLYGIKTIDEGMIVDLTSFYSEAGTYSFRPVSEGVNVSVKIAVNPVVSSGIEITKLSDNNNNNNNLPRCVRIDIYGCEVAEIPLTYPKVLFYNSPTTDNGISISTNYSGICSNVSCTGGNGVLNDGIYGPFATINDTIGITNCSGCRITFFFSTLVTIDTIIIEGMYEATSYSLPPHRVKIVDEGVDIITYDPPNFTSDCSYTPDTYYCLIIGTDINSVSSVTIELESYLDSSILLNEIEFYSNGYLLNSESEQIDNEGNILSTTTTTPPIQTTATIPPMQTTTTTTTPPMQTTATIPPMQTTTTTTTPPMQTTTTTATTDIQTPPPTIPPPIQNTPPIVTTDPVTTGGGQGLLPPPPPPPLPPQTTEEIFNLAAPATIISIFLCITCLITGSIGIFLVTFCWFFLIKYKLRYELAKKELDRHKTTQDVLAKTSMMHSNNYPELLFEQFPNKSVIRPQMDVSVTELQEKPPLPNNHPPSNSYYSQERIYEAIPAKKRPPSKSSSVYEVEELDDYTLESYGNMQGHNSSTNPFSKVSMTSSQVGDNSNLLNGIKEEGYMAMSAAV